MLQIFYFIDFIFFNGISIPSNILFYFFLFFFNGISISSEERWFEFLTFTPIIEQGKEPSIQIGIWKKKKSVKPCKMATWSLSSELLTSLALLWRSLLDCRLGHIVLSSQDICSTLLHCKKVACGTSGKMISDTRYLLADKEARLSIFRAGWIDKRMGLYFASKLSFLSSWIFFSMSLFYWVLFSNVVKRSSAHSCLFFFFSV